MTAPRSPMPLDYPSFTRYIEENDGRLLTMAEDRRRAKLLSLFDRHLLPAPNSISVAFSPRPLDSTDLLDDLRCLIRSVEALEQDNKRLRGRCAYLSTVNDLLSKQSKPAVSVDVQLVAVAPPGQLTPGPPTRRVETFTETTNSPVVNMATATAPRSPPASAPNTSVVVNKQHRPKDDIKSDLGSNKLQSLGAKMTKAATKLLSRNRKTGGSIRVPGARASLIPQSVSGLQPSSSGSSLTDQNVIISTSRSKSFEKQNSLALDEPPKMSESTTSIETSQPVQTRRHQRHGSVREIRPRCGSESHHTSRPDVRPTDFKSEDEYERQSEHSFVESPDPFKHPLLRGATSAQVPPRTISPATSACESYSPMIMSTDSLSTSVSAKKQQPPPALINDTFSKEVSLPQTTRERAWTWDETVRAATTRPWNRIKQMLRRASTPATTSGVLNDTVTTQPQRRLITLRKRRPSETSQNKATQPAKRAEQSSPSTSSTSDKRSFLKMPLIQQDAAPNEGIGKTLHLLALTGSGEIAEQQDNQRKQISKALALIKADEDDDAKLSELAVAEIVGQFDAALGNFIDGLWTEFRVSLAENRAIKRAYLSDRLKLLEWANAHCSRLLNEHQPRGPDSPLKKRFSHRGSHGSDDGMSNVRARYNESTGLCYGKSGGSQQPMSSYKPHRPSRRWFTIGAADRMSTAQRDVSCRLAASLCALFSSLEPLPDLPTPTVADSRSQSLGVLFKEAEESLYKSATCRQTNEIADDNYNNNIIPDTMVVAPSEHGSAVGTPTAQRTPMSARAMLTRSLSREEVFAAPIAVELVVSQPSVATAAEDTLPNLFSPTGIAVRKTSQQLKLMSAEELMRSVARSRSASMCSANTASITLSTATSLTDASNISLADKRRSIAETGLTSRSQQPSLAAVAIAVDFVSVATARQRAASTGSQTGRVRMRAVKEPELPVLMSPITMSPASSDRYDSSICEMMSPTSCDRNASPTPPLISSTSPTGSIRTVDSSSHPMQLPTVQRLTPTITVSPDRFATSHVSRGRIKSLIELSATSQIGKIFASRESVHRGVPTVSKSAPSSSPSPTNTLSPATASNSKSSVALLCPPPILPRDMLPIVSTIQEPTSTNKQQPVPPPPSALAEKRPSKHFAWFSKLLRRPPSPLKRFSSCGVGPEEDIVNQMGKYSSPPYSLRSLSPNNDPKTTQSPSTSSVKNFLKRNTDKSKSKTAKSNAGK